MSPSSYGHRNEPYNGLEYPTSTTTPFLSNNSLTTAVSGSSATTLHAHVGASPSSASSNVDPTFLISRDFQWPAGLSFDAAGNLVFDSSASTPAGEAQAQQHAIAPAQSKNGSFVSHALQWPTDSTLINGPTFELDQQQHAPSNHALPTNTDSDQGDVNNFISFLQRQQHQQQQHHQQQPMRMAGGIPQHLSSSNVQSNASTSPSARFHPYGHHASPRSTTSLTSPAPSSASPTATSVINSNAPTPAAAMTHATTTPLQAVGMSAPPPFPQQGTGSAGTSSGFQTPAVGASPLSATLESAGTTMSTTAAATKVLHNVMYPDASSLPVVQFQLSNEPQDKPRQPQSMQQLGPQEALMQHAMTTKKAMTEIGFSKAQTENAAQRLRRLKQVASQPQARTRRAKSFSGLGSIARTSMATSSTHDGQQVQADKLERVFATLDEVDLTIGDFVNALFDVDVSDDVERGRFAHFSRQHIDRLAKFVTQKERVVAAGRKAPPNGPSELIDSIHKLVSGPTEMTDDQLETTLSEIYRTQEGTGSVIRNILTRDGSTYAESPIDIEMLDATLSRAPSPGAFGLSRAQQQHETPHLPPRFTGRLIVAPTQADILGSWLMAPGRPSLAEEKDSIRPDHMRIYSSLPPLELHARGAELCRVILTRDRALKAQYGHLTNELERFMMGPAIPISKRCGFHEYDDYSLWHHACLTYLQLCTRYPNFRASKPASIVIEPDLTSLSSTALELKLVEKALQTHWEQFRQHLLSEGGLLRSAVRMFAQNGTNKSKMGESTMTTKPVDLMLICEDTNAVLKALKKSLQNPSERILPYDPQVSEARNAWRQSAFWSDNSHFVGWSAATTHFLEISALYPRFAENVRELPGLQTLLKRE
ncbi:hypothetical protein OIO90_000952 [Microbotryomycetes sp. JL221]|nr:hypothetical protein OIO90_000952 [Microbotryomycetes sp. JL221]